MLKPDTYTISMTTSTRLFCKTAGFAFTGLMLMVLSGFAQKSSEIKGTVLDSLSNERLGFATVAALSLKDSSLISYTVTVKDGSFILHNMPAEKDLKLVISFVNYENYRSLIRLNQGQSLNLGEIKLRPKNRSLNEVTIKGEAIPVVVIKDSIEFSAEAFKTPPNAIVEELLKRLPGVQVDIDGTITVNGKSVSKLLVNGHEFFVNDPKIASRNLEASLIDKVQIYDDRENDPDHLLPNSKVKKIINLKFKTALKKSTFGKFRAGVGTEDRFDAGALYNMFRDTLQVSMIGIGNNLNRTGFSSQELSTQGGFERSGTDVNNSGLNNGGGDDYGNIQTVASGGANVNTDYGNKLKLNLLYFYSYTSDKYKADYLSQQFLKDTTLNKISNDNDIDINSKHTISGLVQWKPDTAVSLRYTPKLTLSANNATYLNDYQGFSNFAPQLNSGINYRDVRGNAIQFQHTLLYYHKLRKPGASLIITHNLDISPNHTATYSDNDFTSFLYPATSSSLRRFADNKKAATSGVINITYRAPISKKWIGDIAFEEDYRHNNGQLFNFNKNIQTGQYDIYIDTLSYSLARSQFIATLLPEITYQINPNTYIKVTAGLQSMNTDDRFNKSIPDINRYGFFLLPAIQFTSDKFSFDYNEIISQPSINDLLPITTFYNQLYSTIGNPGLKPSRSRNFSASFYNYNQETQFSTSINGNVNLDENAIVQAKTIDTQGAVVSKPVNTNGQYYIYLGINMGKGYKKVNNWQMRVNLKIYGSTNHNFFRVNGIDGYENPSYIAINPQVTLNWNNKIEITPAYNISPTITTYQHVGYKTVKYATQQLDMPVVVRWPKHTTIEIAYKYTYNPLTAGLQSRINLLNLSVARLIQFKDQGEIRLSCYDILNQNVSSYRFTSGNSVTDVQNQIIKRYFLLSYAYRFNSTTVRK